MTPPRLALAAAGILTLAGVPYVAFATCPNGAVNWPQCNLLPPTSTIATTAPVPPPTTPVLPPSSVATPTLPNESPAPTPPPYIPSPDTSTTVPATVAAAPTTSTALPPSVPGELPATGGDAGVIALCAAGVLAFGFGARRTARGGNDRTGGG